jgi:hypothetical protein
MAKSIDQQIKDAMAKTHSIAFSGNALSPS